MGNRLFEAAIEAKGYTQAALAAAVCDEVQRSSGRRPGVDERAIRRLVAGDTHWPTAQTRDALRTLLGAETNAELGFFPERVKRAATRNQLVTQVIKLGRYDVERRGFLTSGVAAIGALAVPGTDDLIRRAKRTTGTVRVGAGEVTAVQQMTRILGDAGAELGGGHARVLVVRYLTDDVRPWLDGTYTAAVGRDLFAAASRLVHLAGWMAADDGEDDLARGYYTLSSELAREAKDPEAEATALRGLAVHAISLGLPAEAKDYAAGALAAGGKLSDPRAVAYYQTTMAESAALSGERRAALSALSAAEHAIGRAPEHPGESWSSHFTAGRWAHATGMILSRLGETDAAVAHQRHALDVYGINRRRSRAHVLAAMAEIQIDAGDAAGGFDAYRRFLVEAHGVRSAKVSDAVRRIHALPDRFPGASEARDLSARAAAVAL